MRAALMSRNKREVKVTLQELVTLEECVLLAFDTPEFMEGYRRLMNCDFGRSSGLNLEIDMASGHYEAQALAFIAFVKETIFDRLGAS